jgi:hypothetical protein
MSETKAPTPTKKKSTRKRSGIKPVIKKVAYFTLGFLLVSAVVNRITAKNATAKKLLGA